MAAVTFCYGFGGIAILGGCAKLAFMLWYNIEYGRIISDAESSRNALTITPLNLLSCALSFGLGTGFWVVACSIWNRRRWLAIVPFVVALVCGFATAALAPYTDHNSYNDLF